MRTAGILFAFCASIFAIKDDNYTAEPNSPFTSLHNFGRTVQSVTLKGSLVSKGSQSKPCQVGASCWQPLNDTQYSALWYNPDAGTGAIILTAVDASKRRSAIIVKGNGQTPKLPGDIGLTKELAINAPEKTEVLILYGADVNATEIEGDIKYLEDSSENSTHNTLMVPYLNDKLKGEEVCLLLGLMNSTSLEYTFTFADGQSALIRFRPAEGRPSPTLFDISFNGAKTLAAWRIMVYILSFISAKDTL
ncbi:hypothetical protein SprV_0802478900 [Sparganum proliferum]